MRGSPLGSYELALCFTHPLYSVCLSHVVSEVAVQGGKTCEAVGGVRISRLMLFPWSLKAPRHSPHNLRGRAER